MIKMLQKRNITFNTDINNLYGIFECIEYLGRQSKYILNMQSAYEFYNYSWRMPLWSNQVMDFWEVVELKHKINKKLYSDTLYENNWGGAWKDIQ